MIDDRIMELESRLAFQEEHIEVLSQAVSRQQKIIDDLRREMAELRQRLKAVSAAPLIGYLKEPPPPHY